jgi:hypothetical protein
MGQSQAKPGHWVPDDATSECGVCNRQFTVVTRRHHCRCCGNLCCNRCSSERSRVPERNIFKKVRVCDRCLILLRAKSNGSDSQAPSTARQSGWDDERGYSESPGRPSEAGRSRFSGSPDRPVQRRAPSSISPRITKRASDFEPQRTRTAPPNSRSAALTVGTSGNAVGPAPRLSAISICAVRRFCLKLRHRGLTQAAVGPISRLIEDLLASAVQFATSDKISVAVHPSGLYAKSMLWSSSAVGAYPITASVLRLSQHTTTRLCVALRSSLVSGTVRPVELACVHESTIRDVIAGASTVAVDSIAQLQTRAQPIGINSCACPIGGNKGRPVALEFDSAGDGIRATIIFDPAARLVRFDVFASDRHIWEGSWVPLPPSVAGGWHVAVLVPPVKSQTDQGGYVRIVS